MNQDMKDGFTDELLNWARGDTQTTRNSHKTAWSEGGSEMVVGNADSNRNSKTEKVY